MQMQEIFDKVPNVSQCSFAHSQTGEFDIAYFSQYMSEGSKLDYDWRQNLKVSYEDIYVADEMIYKSGENEVYLERLVLDTCDVRVGFRMFGKLLIFGRGFMQT